jgi:hypothetical protein
MGKLEPISRVKLSDVLTAPDAQLQRSLPSAELAALGALMESMARRWPQEVEESIGAYLADMERLAMRYRLSRVFEAVEALRTAPGQKFFPRPDEIADEIERQKARREATADVRRADEYCNWLHEQMRICKAERAEAAARIEKGAE